MDTGPLSRSPAFRGSYPTGSHGVSKEAIEVCSLVEGAWYDVLPTSCFLVWVKSEPMIRIKFKEFDFSDCEYFALENLFEGRIRGPSTVAEIGTDFSIGQVVFGLAKTDTEQKWFDAVIENISYTKDDVLIEVEWKLGLYFLIFGEPKHRKLSIKNGEVAIPGGLLSPLWHPVLIQWSESLRELSGTKVVYEETIKRFPVERLKIPQTKAAAEKKEWMPNSMLNKTLSSKKTKRRRSTPVMDTQQDRHSQSMTSVHSKSKAKTWALDSVEGHEAPNTDFHGKAPSAI